MRGASLSAPSQARTRRSAAAVGPVTLGSAPERDGPSFASHLWQRRAKAGGALMARTKFTTVQRPANRTRGAAQNVGVARGAASALRAARPRAAGGGSGTGNHARPGGAACRRHKKLRDAACQWAVEQEGLTRGPDSWSKGGRGGEPAVHVGRPQLAAAAHRPLSSCGRRGQVQRHTLQRGRGRAAPSPTQSHAARRGRWAPPAAAARRARRVVRARGTPGEPRRRKPPPAKSVLSVRLPWPYVAAVAS